jgi:hypothetical protein
MFVDFFSSQSWHWVQLFSAHFWMIAIASVVSLTLDCASVSAESKLWEQLREPRTPAISKPTGPISQSSTEAPHWGRTCGSDRGTGEAPNARRSCRCVSCVCGRVVISRDQSGRRYVHAATITYVNRYRYYYFLSSISRRWTRRKFY